MSALARLTLRGSTSRIHEVHQGIADRAFAAVGPVGRPVQVVHDAVSGLSYSSVRLALGGGAGAAGLAAALRANGRDLDADRSGRVALAILNGAHGDLVQRVAPALALDMTVRVAGRAVPVTTAALAEAFPGANGRLAVFLHGLTESEASWCFQAERHHGHAGVTYGSLLQEDLGLTPVHLRYNTGLHISDNGRSLDRLLAALVEAWPVPVQDVVLIGHSMGGLVARSALHQAGGGTPEARAWTHLVRDTITLGSPHLGAPLERGVHRLAAALARLPETRPLARLLTLRSVGIKDLRHGTLVEADWTDRDLDELTPGPHTHVPLLDGARQFVVLATLSRNPAGRVADLLGDLLVPPRSASGDTGDETASPSRPIACTASAGCTTSICSTTRGCTSRSGAGCSIVRKARAPVRRTHSEEERNRPRAPRDRRRSLPLITEDKGGTVADPGEQDQNIVQRLINWRVSAAMEPHPPNETLLKVQQPFYDLLNKFYFRLEVDGWEHVPDETCLVVGVHSGGALTMDAWTLVNAWHTHFDGKRHLHGTAHDVLMATPGLGDYFRAVGVIAANRKSVGTALADGRDVVVWPGGEVDSMRSWRKRDVATLGGRTGFVKQAIRSGVPILPVATVGGHDTVFVISEGKWLANALDKVTGLKNTLRGSNLPIIAGLPFPLAVEVLPAHVPLPAKIRTQLLEPIEVDHDPERADDKAYVQKIYDQVEAEIQAGMDRLAAKRSLPVFG
ncbi:MAG: 1-acyl-sn-glycerol-3-phosphate acyltransferase [Blastococcus sp.]